MSHELRTPLNAILGYTELMADGAYGEPSKKMVSILQRLEANGRHLLGLINDVLDLSKIRPVNSNSNFPITQSRILPRRSAARLSRWRPIKSSHSTSKWPANCRPVVAMAAA
jgi:signal transduction histidine kinase